MEPSQVQALLANQGMADGTCEMKAPTIIDRDLISLGGGNDYL